MNRLALCHATHRDPHRIWTAPRPAAAGRIRQADGGHPEPQGIRYVAQQSVHPMSLHM